MISKLKKLTISSIDCENLLINIQIRIPLFLTIELWLRYEYNLYDIKRTISCFSSLLLWQCALQFNIIPSSSSVKITLSTSESMVFGSKSIVIHKILQCMAANFPQIKDKPSILKIKSNNVPNIPVVVFDVLVFLEIAKSIPKEKPKLFQDNEITKLFKYKDITFFPKHLHTNKIIMCNRIIPYVDFLEAGRYREKCICSYPVIVFIKNTKYAVMEECFFAITHYSQDATSISSATPFSLSSSAS